jgi:hypothetical protein
MIDKIVVVVQVGETSVDVGYGDVQNGEGGGEVVGRYAGLFCALLG